MSKALIILLDGFNPQDINKTNTPYLNSFRMEHNSSILMKSSPFCERSEFYSGADSNITNNFFAFDFSPLTSNYKDIEKRNYFLFYKVIDVLIDKLARFNFMLDFLNKVKRRFRSYFLIRTIKEKGVYYSINQIPYKFLSQFSLTEDSSHPKKKFSEFKKAFYNQTYIKDKKILNLFDDLCVYKGKLDYYERLEILKSELSDNVNDIFMIANSELDFYMHNNGIKKDSSFVRKIRDIDTTVEQLSLSFLKSNPDGKLFFFSPHGMLNVQKKIDVEKVIQKNISKSKNSYFIDSTAFRVWGDGLNEIWDSLNQDQMLVNNGRFVWSSDFYTIHKKQKHIIWFANTGIICFPDFFRRTLAPKGMHGYTDLRVQDGFIITNGCLEKEEFMISEVSSIINESLRN
jgi:hypothetical protein